MNQNGNSLNLFGSINENTKWNIVGSDYGAYCLKNSQSGQFLSRVGGYSSMVGHCGNNERIYIYGNLDWNAV